MAVDLSGAHGCEKCNMASLAGMVAPLENIATENEGPVLLYRCKECGCLWIETLREAHPISKDEAENIFTTTKWKVR